MWARRVYKALISIERRDFITTLGSTATAPCNSLRTWHLGPSSIFEGEFFYLGDILFPVSLGCVGLADTWRI